MLAISLISTMNVLCPAARSSDAPMRVNTRSTTPMTALCAGTNEPICAMSTMSAVWRMYVDLPAMFGPVTMATRSSASLRNVSFGTKRLSFCACSTTGWRPSRMSSVRERSTSGQT